MDTYNFENYNVSPDDILKATAEKSKATNQNTQNIEGYGDFFSVDTYQNIPNTQFGSSGNEIQTTNTDVSSLENLQNFDFTSYQNEQPIDDILSNLQINNEQYHESLEPYVDPSSEINVDYLLNQNQKGTTKKTTTTTTTTKTYNTTVPSGLTKEEEQNILNLVKNQSPQAFNQVNQNVNLDSLPTEVVYLDDIGQTNLNNQVNIVNNDVISKQIQAQTSGLETQTFPSESPIIDTGLTLGNLENYPGINDYGGFTTTKVETKQTTTTYTPTVQPPVPVANPPIIIKQPAPLNVNNLAPLPNQNIGLEIGEYATTTKVDGKQSMYVPPVEPTVPAPVRPLIIRQRPPLTVGNIAPIPNTGTAGVGLEIGEYRTTTKIDGKESMFVPSVEPTVPLTTSTIVKVPKVQQVIVPKVQKVVVPKKIIINRNSVSPSRIPLQSQIVSQIPVQTTTTTALPVAVNATPAIPAPIIPTTTSTVRLPYSILSTPGIRTSQIPVQTPAVTTVQTKVITPPPATVAIPPPPITTMQTRIIPPPPAPLAVQTPPITTVPVTKVITPTPGPIAVQTPPLTTLQTTRVITPTPPITTVPVPKVITPTPAPIAVQTPAITTVPVPKVIPPPTPIAVQPPAVTTMTIPKVLPPPATSIALPPPAVVPKVIPSPVQVPLTTTIQKPIIPVGQQPLPYSIASQTIPYSTASQPIPYSTASQPVVVPSTIPAPSIATIPPGNVVIPPTTQVVSRPLPMQNIVTQPQLQPLTQLRYPNSNYPLVGRNIIPTNLTRPTTYHVSTFRPMVRNNIPLSNQIGGIGMVPAGNMNAPLMYNSRTYNARRL